MKMQKIRLEYLSGAQKAHNAVKLRNDASCKDSFSVRFVRNGSVFLTFSTSLKGIRPLITRRSLVQVQPPQPLKSTDSVRISAFSVLILIFKDKPAAKPYFAAGLFLCRLRTMHACFCQKLYFSDTEFSTDPLLGPPDKF